MCGKLSHESAAEAYQTPKRKQKTAGQVLAISQPPLAHPNYGMSAWCLLGIWVPAVERF